MVISRSKVSIRSAESKAAIDAEITHKQLIQGRKKELRENTDFVSTLLESLVGYAIIASDFDGNIIAYNEGAHQIYGYAPEEIIGRQNMEIFFPEDFIEAGKLHQIIGRLMEKENYSYEGEKVRKNGKRFPAQILFNVTRDKNSKLVGFVEIVQDLTERQRMQQQLLNNLENFHKVITDNADGIIITNKEGIVSFVNPAAESIFSRKAEKFMGKQFGYPAISGETTEIDIIRKDGAPQVAEMHVVKTEWEGGPAYLLSLRDVTERTQGREAVKSSELRYRRLFEAARDGILILNRESGEIEDVNPYLIEILGYPREDFLGKKLWEIGAFNDIRLARSAYDELLREQYIRYEDLPLRTKNGKLVDVEFISNVYDVDHIPVIQCNIRNISERKKAQAAQERFTRELQEKVSELEAFSYGIAHDLRSPLVSVEGFSRLLREDLKNRKTENVEEDIRLIETGVTKMRQLLNSTLEYSRAGYQVKQTGNVSFGKIVREVVAEFGEQVCSTGATITVAKKFPRIYADRMRIVQVLTNLIQNSIKYRDETRPLEIEIGYQSSGDESAFFVRDNGIGIDAGEVENVFALFYRGTSDGEGSGAGLAIVKRIIEAHGGRVWVQDQSREGTTLCFTLPHKNGTGSGGGNGKG